MSRNLGFMGFPDYLIDSKLNVWSKRKKLIGRVWKRLKPRICGHGRLYFMLVDKYGVSRSTALHHIVLFVHVGPRPVGKEACHRDGDHTNNKPDNLRWGTHKENMQDRSLHGRSARFGEINGSAVLTNKQAKRMRSLRAKGWKYRELMEKFQVGFHVVALVCRNETYRYI
jgi:hypothetical protein